MSKPNYHLSAFSKKPAYIILAPLLTFTEHQVCLGTNLITNFCKLIIIVPFFDVVAED